MDTGTKITVVAKHSSDNGHVTPDPDPLHSRFHTLCTWLRRFMPLVTALGSLLIGGFFLIHTPVGHIPDIWSHVYRVSSITHGDFLAHPVNSRSLFHNVDAGAVGGRVDRAWMEFGWSMYDGYDPSIALPESVQSESDGLVDLPFNNTATNPPLTYAPQVLAFGVGGMLHLPVSTIYIMAEVSMLLAYCLCMFLGIRALPRWRIGTGFVMLLPPLLFRSSFAISADSFTQAIVFLFTCMVFRTAHKEVSHSYCLLLGLVGLTVAMCKFIYMPLALMALLAPLLQKWLKDAERIDRLDLIVLSGFTALSLIWECVWTSVNSWYTTAPMFVSFQAMQARKHELLAHPGEIASVVQRIMWAICHGQGNNTPYGGSLILQLAWIGIAMMVVILVIATATKSESKYDSLFSWCFTAIGLGILFLTYLALWLQYSSFNLPGVNGMQMRYFFPLALGFALVTFTGLSGLTARFANYGKTRQQASEKTNLPSLA